MQKSVVFLPTFHPVGKHGAVREGLALEESQAVVLTVTPCPFKAQNTSFSFLDNSSLVLDAEVS